MSDQIISTASIAFIESSLAALNSRIGTVNEHVLVVHGKVEEAAQEISTTRQELATLATDFAEFVHRDRLAKALQLAETRVVKVRQELEQKFGHLAEVRKRTTGILQAVDVRVVRTETMHSGTEELMVKAPRYWLAPGLVALTAWLTDNQELANRALQEALRRDTNKTCLLFALISRRGNRHGPAARWLDHYFGLQDPTNMDREVVLLLEAVAHGIFGPEGRQICSRSMDSWLAYLTARDGFVDEQRKHWAAALERFTPRQMGETDFPRLRQIAGNWSELQSSLLDAHLHQPALDHFTRVFNYRPEVSPKLVTQVDDILDKLVSRFDDEELPLRRQERLLSLIIDENGDEKEARTTFDVETKALEEHVSFTQILTNAAIHSDTTGASSATQRLATALSRDWIEAAHNQLTAQSRATAPASAKLTLMGWSGETKDGSEEAVLVPALEAVIKAQEEKALAAIGIGAGGVIAAIGAILSLLFALSSPGWLVVTLICGIIFVVKFRGIKTRKAQTRATYEKSRADNVTYLRATLAEMVDYRRAWAQADAVAGKLAPLLRSFDPREMTAPDHSGARQIVYNN